MTDENVKPQLLVLTTTFPRWSGDHEPPFVYELARRLTDSFKVTVLAPHAPGAAREEVMDGVAVRRFRYAPDRLEKLAYDGGIPTRLRRHPWLALLVPAFLLALLTASFRLTRVTKPAVIHAHWLVPAGLVGAVIKGVVPGQRKLLITAHGADVHLRGRWPIGWLKGQAVRSADVVSVVSRALRDQVAPAAPSATRIEIAPMGVDLQRLFTPATAPVQKPVLVFAGRLVEKKGVADLIRATPKVLEQVPEARLLVAGHGPLADELQALAERLQINAAVEFLGCVPNAELPDVLRRGKLVVLPFRTADDGDVEGLGLVAVEAMGCGLPVIVGDVPAIHDVVTHGETGWILPSTAPEALATAIVRLLEDDALTMRLSESGRRHVLQKFDWSIVAKRYRDTLLELSD
jgi:glycosyltransferase involved in cell wall biosynthesis